MICPKCHYMGLYQPNYSKDQFGREYLEERCTRCGYAERKQIKDKENYPNDAITQANHRHSASAGECMNPYTTRERYHIDVDFKRMVDVLYALIREHGYTPQEVREAAMMASLIYAERHVEPQYIMAIREGKEPTT